MPFDPSTYQWIRAFHIIAVVAWFAGLFYMPRLFVYHSSAEDKISRDRFEIMEAKLYRIIMRPAMIVSVVLGLLLLASAWQSYGAAVWMWIKLALVVGLLGYHHVCGSIIRGFAAGSEERSEKFFRIFNEVPTLFLILIVILVVVKPF